MAETNEEQKQYYSMNEAMDYLKTMGIKLGKGSLINLIFSGEIAVIQLSPRKRYISREALHEYIDKHTGKYSQE